MKKPALLLLMVITLLFACKKEDACQEEQSKCNGYRYDCELKTCMCELPYTGDACTEYYYEAYEGMYRGDYIEYRFFESGSVTVPKNEEESHFLYIEGLGVDSLCGLGVNWSTEYDFELLDNQGMTVGGGSVEPTGEIYATWEGKGMAVNGVPYESITLFKGHRIW